MNQTAKPSGSGDFIFSAMIIMAGISAVVFLTWHLGPVFLLIVAVFGLNWLLWGRMMPPRQPDETDETR